MKLVYHGCGVMSNSAGHIRGGKKVTGGGGQLTVGSAVGVSVGISGVAGTGVSVGGGGCGVLVGGACVGGTAVLGRLVGAEVGAGGLGGLGGGV